MTTGQLLTTLFSIGLSISANAEFDRADWATKKLTHWEQEANEISRKSIPAYERIEKIGMILRSIGSAQDYGSLSNEASSFRMKLQNEILAIPGHAEYFTSKIKEEQARLQNIPSEANADRSEYNRLRYQYLAETLIHLPSPETIQALGELLWDEKDAPHPIKPGQDWLDPRENSFLAAQSLRRIGLRDNPQPMLRVEDRPDIKLWRSWYEEVKSGKRAFSFEGKSVEYRLKQDGTVTTTPIKMEERSAASGDQKAENQASRETPARSFQWLWFLGGLVAFCFALLAANRIRTKK